jgi:hypothetical protein
VTAPHHEPALKAALLASGVSTDLTADTPCKICGETAACFDAMDFNRAVLPENYPFGFSGVPIYYHRCSGCGLIFTRAFDALQPDAWAKLVYNAAYFATLDPDYQSLRPTLNAELVRAIARAIGRSRVVGVDYGGGSGALSRLLRADGLTFASYDPFDVQDPIEDRIGEFSLVSSFEVLEHTVDPLGTMRDMLRLASADAVLILSTQTSDGLVDDERRLAWNYFGPRNGHVTIYARESLKRIARHFALEYVRVSRGLHLFGRSLGTLQVLKYVAGGVKLKQRIRSRLGS